MNIADISEIVTDFGCGMKYVSGFSVTKSSHQAVSSNLQVYMSFRVKVLNTHWDLLIYRHVVSVFPCSVNYALQDESSEVC